jgi:hypothetical protein
LTIAIAIVGAVTGILGLLLNLRREWLDRPRLAVQVDPLANTDGTGSLKAIIENRGRQPVTVGRVGLEWKVEGPVPHRPEGEVLFNDPWSRTLVPPGGNLVVQWDVPAKPYTHLDCPLRGFARYGDKMARSAPVVYYRILEQMGWRSDATVDPALIEQLPSPLKSRRVESWWRWWRPKHLRSTGYVAVPQVSAAVEAARARVQKRDVR